MPKYVGRRFGKMEILVGNPSNFFDDNDYISVPDDWVNEHFDTLNISSGQLDINLLKEKRINHVRQERKEYFLLVDSLFNTELEYYIQNGTWRNITLRDNIIARRVRLRNIPQLIQALSSIQEVVEFVPDYS